VKPTFIYEETRNIEAVRQLLGQRSLDATKAYLGIDKKQALAIGRRFDVL